MELEEIVVALNRNLEKEYASVFLYIQFSGDSRISKDPELPRIISALAEDEMGHAEKLADTIAEIGGAVHMTPRAVRQEEDAQGEHATYHESRR